MKGDSLAGGEMGGSKGSKGPEAFWSAKGPNQEGMPRGKRERGETLVGAVEVRPRALKHSSKVVLRLEQPSGAGRARGSQQEHS